MTCGQDRTLKLWNPHKDITSCIQTYPEKHGYAILDFTISSDNAQFASCGLDKHIFVWQVSTGTIIRKLQGHTERINAVSYSQDDSILASASYDQSVALWDMRSRNSHRPIQILKQFQDSVTSVVIHGDKIIAG